MKRHAWLFLVALVIVMRSVVASAETSPAQPDQQAMMEAMKKNGAPGEHHQALAPLAGTWVSTASWWKSPDAPPEVSQGTSTMEWVLDGRFLKQSFTGTAMGQPFTGMGFIGYDNVRGEYTSIWMDSMMTGIMTAAGTYDAAAQTLQESGSFSCPMTGEKNMWFRTDWKIVDQDHNTYESYSKTSEGKEYKALEIAYTRQS